ncbi:MAG: hypothetical protein LLG00_11605 [Planctomycetaceae bacterium]|nr:hypothetical protein [Planctomycetaceae bacterium]
MATTIMQTVRTLALLALVCFSAMAARQAKQPSDKPVATPAIDTAAGAAATIRFGGEKPGVTFPIIHGARDVAKFADDLAAGFRQDGYVEARVMLPNGMRGKALSLTKANTLDTTGVVAQPRDTTAPPLPEDPKAGEQPDESGCGCAGGVCPEPSRSWRRGRR